MAAIPPPSQSTSTFAYDEARAQFEFKSDEPVTQSEHKAALSMETKDSELAKAIGKSELEEHEKGNQRKGGDRVPKPLVEVPDSDRPELMRDWLVRMINSGQFPGLKWMDEEKTIFRVPWIHAKKRDYNQERDAALFREWAIHSGTYGDGSDVTTWKINFRCALNGLKDIIERRDLEETDCRVYQMLPFTDPRKTRRIKQSHPQYYSSDVVSYSPSERDVCPRLELTSPVTTPTISTLPTLPVTTAIPIQVLPIVSGPAGLLRFPIVASPPTPQPTTPKPAANSWDAKLDMMKEKGAKSLRQIEAKLKMPGKIAGHLKKKIVSELAELRKALVAGFTQAKEAIQSMFTSKASGNSSSSGHAAIQKHFGELWGAISNLGMLDLTTKVFSKGLITAEVKRMVFSTNGTSSDVKADALLSAIQERIKNDPSTFDVFVEIRASI